MPIIEFSPKSFIRTLGYKLITVCIWLLSALIIRNLFFQDGIPMTQSGIALGFIEILAGLFPVYLIWVLIFLLFGHIMFKRKEVSFQFLLLIVLALNFLELIFIYGHFFKFLRAYTDIRVLNIKMWYALPDFPEPRLSAAQRPAGAWSAGTAATVPSVFAQLFAHG